MCAWVPGCVCAVKRAASEWVDGWIDGCSKYELMHVRNETRIEQKMIVNKAEVQAINQRMNEGENASRHAAIHPAPKSNPTAKRNWAASTAKVVILIE